MISNFKAKDAINKLSEYCNTHDCRTECAIYDACLKLGNCKPVFFGRLANGIKNSSKKWTKFDAALNDSPIFSSYMERVAEEEAKKVGLNFIGGFDMVKCYPNGTIKVWYKGEDGETVYRGKAKCHPRDTFNPEIGIKLAVQRIVEKLNKPFVPAGDEAYYYVDDKNLIYSTINHNSNKDALNIAVGNCFRKYKEAQANADVIMKRIGKATKLLEKLRDEGDEQHETCLRTRLPETWGKVETL